MLHKGDDKEAVFADILTEIADNNRSVADILRDPGFPHMSTFFDWLAKDPSKAEAYTRACEIRAEHFAKTIEDDYNATPEYTATRFGEKVDTGWVQMQKLKIDSKKWLAARMSPKKYGDKLDVTSGDKPIQTAPPIFGDNPLDRE